jgi:hypothetical protein
MKKFAFWAAFLCISLGFVQAQEPAVQHVSFSPEIKRVAVFKNGYAFTYREGEARISNGWAYTTRVPIGVLGTVWGYSTLPNVRVQQLLASQDEAGASERVTNTAEFLLANVGRQVRIETQFTENGKFLTGTYEILKPDIENLSPQQRNSPSYGTAYSYYDLQNLTIALKTESGVKVFPAQTIKTVEVIGEAKTLLAKKSNRLGLKIEGAKDGQSINLGVAALERGIRWIPAYRVEVKGLPIKEAKLELEGMLINELTDLNNTEVNFVVGVPHFLFQDMMSPLSMNTAFAGVSSYFQQNNRNENSYSNALMSQVSSRDARMRTVSEDGVTPSPTLVDEEKLSSFSAEQLFLYKSDQISLKKGERASLRLFSLTVPATEVFEWTLSDAPDTQNRYLNSSGNYSDRQQSLLQDLSTKVWYALRLKNTTGMPWTTAPALSFREWKPLGQDMLKFTPVGGEEILRVTPATEVIGTNTLVEKERVRERLRWNGSDYEFDLVTVEGTLKLKNVKKQPVEIVLTRNLVGDVISAGDGGIVSKEGLNLQAVNPNSIIKWNLTLPGGEKEIRYTYKVYVRK